MCLLIFVRCAWEFVENWEVILRGVLQPCIWVPPGSQSRTTTRTIFYVDEQIALQSAVHQCRLGAMISDGYGDIMAPMDVSAWPHWASLKSSVCFWGKHVDTFRLCNRRFTQDLLIFNQLIDIIPCTASTKKLLDIFYIIIIDMQ